MSDGREQLALLTQVLQKDEAKLERDNQADNDEADEDDIRYVNQKTINGKQGLSSFTGGNDPAFE